MLGSDTRRLQVEFCRTPRSGINPIYQVQKNLVLGQPRTLIEFVTELTGKRQPGGKGVVYSTLAEKRLVVISETTFRMFTVLIIRSTEMYKYI